MRAVHLSIHGRVQGASPKALAGIEAYRQGPVSARISGVKAQEMTLNAAFRKKFIRL